MKYDLTIAYRICPSLSGNCGLFNSDEKLLLSEICLKSLADSLEGLKVKFFAILDSCTSDYNEIFKKHIAAEDLEIIEINSKSNRGSFLQQMEILLAQEYSDNIFFAEDDYFYLPNKFHLMLSYFNNNSVEFLTPYNNRAYYKDPLSLPQSTFNEYKEYIWQETNITCMTFLTTKQTFIETKSFFRHI